MSIDKVHFFQHYRPHFFSLIRCTEKSYRRTYDCVTSVEVTKDNVLMFISSYHEKSHPAWFSGARRPDINFSLSCDMQQRNVYFWIAGTSMACSSVLLRCIWTFTCCCLYSRLSVSFRLIFHSPCNLVT